MVGITTSVILKKTMSIDTKTPNGLSLRSQSENKETNISKEFSRDAITILRKVSLEVERNFYVCI